MRSRSSCRAGVGMFRTFQSPISCVFVRLPVGLCTNSGPVAPPQIGTQGLARSPPRCAPTPPGWGEVGARPERAGRIVGAWEAAADDRPRAGRRAAGPSRRAGSGPLWARGPALVYRDADGVQQAVLLDPLPSLTIGRGSGCDVRLPWDERVSRVHAQLDRVGRNWTLVDDGLSRNGTFLNGERVNGRRRLYDGDTFVLGATSFGYRDAQGGTSQLTTVGDRGGHRRRRCRPPSGRSSRRCAGPTSTRRPTRRRPPTSRSPASCSSASTRSRPTCARCSRSSTSRTCRRTRSAPSSSSGPSRSASCRGATCEALGGCRRMRAAACPVAAVAWWPLSAACGGTGAWSGSRPGTTAPSASRSAAHPLPGDDRPSHPGARRTPGRLRDRPARSRPRPVGHRPVIGAAPPRPRRGGGDGEPVVQRDHRQPAGAVHQRARRGGRAVHPVVRRDAPEPAQLPGAVLRLSPGGHE